MNKNQVEDIEILVDRNSSGKKRKWAMYKKDNMKLSEVYDCINPKKAVRLRECANMLSFLPTVEGRLKLKHANFCRVRLCPMCQWRRSLKNYSQIKKILDAINGQYQYIFLTLTVKNCQPEDLSKTLDTMLLAFNLFTKYKRIQDSIKGWYRGLEITHNTKTDTFHPHIHVLMAVKSYFFTTKAYIKHDEFMKLWKRALKAEYDPRVDIRRVKGNDAKAIAEVAKYSCKPEEIIYYDDWSLRVNTIRILDAALANRRLVAYGGVLKEWHKKLNLDDPDDGNLVDIGDGDELATVDNELLFAWHTGYCQYVRTYID